MAASKKTPKQIAAAAQKRIKRLKTADEILTVRSAAPAKPGRFKKHKEGKPELDAKIADHNTSVFEKRLKGIRKANKVYDYSEVATLKMYKGLIDMILSLIPIAEKNYRTYKVDKSAYALNVLVNQSRELLNDLRAVADFNQQADRIVEMARRQFTLIAQALVDEAYRLKKEIRDDLPPKKRAKLEAKLDGLVRAHGKYLNESVKALATAILEHMTDRQPGNRVANGTGK